jgi:hypothetical protein
MRVLVVAALTLAAAACGPFYSTEYNFIPPSDPHSRACISQCNSDKTQCRANAQASAENEQLRCQVDAGNDYERCLNKAGNDDARKKCSKRSCYANADSANAICDGDFRGCFQSCGGTVESHQVCTFNCPQ